MKRTTIPVYINEEDKKLIEVASRLLSLNQSSFCRTFAIKEARKLILIKNQEEVEQNAVANN